MAKSREQELHDLVTQEIAKNPPRKPKEIIPTPSQLQQLKEAADADARKK